MTIQKFVLSLLAICLAGTLSVHADAIGYCGEGEHIDCRNVCGGPAIHDECGVCEGGGKVGFNTAQAGTAYCCPAGTPKDEGPPNDCGICGGVSDQGKDDCGVCFGPGKTSYNTAQAGTVQCCAPDTYWPEGVPNDCGICGADANQGKDACGACGGPGKTSYNTAQAGTVQCCPPGSYWPEGVPNDCGICGGTTDQGKDVCGVCSGGGKTVYNTAQAGQVACCAPGTPRAEGVPNDCGICGGAANQGKSGCDNRCGSTKVNDCAGTCGGTATLDNIGTCCEPAAMSGGLCSSKCAEWGVEIERKQDDHDNNIYYENAPNLPACAFIDPAPSQAVLDANRIDQLIYQDTWTDAEKNEMVSLLNRNGLRGASIVQKSQDGKVKVKVTHDDNGTNYSVQNWNADSGQRRSYSRYRRSNDDLETWTAGEYLRRRIFNSLFSSWRRVKCAGRSLANMLLCCGVDKSCADANVFGRQMGGKDRGHSFFWFDNNCNFVKTADDGDFKGGRECMAALIEYRSPISLLLDGTKALHEPVAFTQFPLAHDPKGTWYEWRASSSAPLLVFDPDHTGAITNATQLFGNWTLGGQQTASLDSGSAPVPWKHGFQALATFDHNNDGRVNGTELAPLALWFDHNRNGVSEPGEVIAAVEYGLTSLGYQNTQELESGNIYVADGFTIKETAHAKATEGVSVDWFAQSDSSRSVLLNRFLALGEQLRLPPLAESNPLATAVESAENVEQANPAEADDTLAPIREGGDAFTGMYKWEEKPGSKDGAKGALVLFEHDDNTISGYTLVESPVVRKPTAGVSFDSVLSLVPLAGTVKIEEGRKIAQWDTSSQRTTSVTTLTFGTDGSTFPGSSQVSILLESGERTPVEFSFTARRVQ